MNSTFRTIVFIGCWPAIPNKKLKIGKKWSNINIYLNGVNGIHFFKW